MRSYGTIANTFWTRGSGKSLRGDPEAQVVALYLMTSPAANMIGLYHLSIPTLAHETGLTLQGACKGLRRASEAHIAFYDEDDEVVWLPKMAFWQIGPKLERKDNRVKGILSALRQFENHRFYWSFVELYGGCYHLGIEAPPKVLASPLEGPPKPLRSQEQEQEQEQEHPPNPLRGLPADAAEPETKTEKPDPALEATRLRFKAFWESYPKKRDELKTRSEFWKLNPDEGLLEQILESLEIQRESDEWRKENGRYIPRSEIYLAERRWEEAVKPEPEPERPRHAPPGSLPPFVYISRAGNQVRPRKPGETQVCDEDLVEGAGASP